MYQIVQFMYVSFILHQLFCNKAVRNKREWAFVSSRIESPFPQQLTHTGCKSSYNNIAWWIIPKLSGWNTDHLLSHVQVCELTATWLGLGCTPGSRLKVGFRSVLCISYSSERSSCSGQEVCCVSQSRARWMGNSYLGHILVMVGHTFLVPWGPKPKWKTVCLASAHMTSTNVPVAKASHG